MNVRGFLTLIPRARETTSDTPVRFCTTWEKERCKCHLVPIFQVGKFSRLKTAETLQTKWVLGEEKVQARGSEEPPSFSWDPAVALAMG